MATSGAPSTPATSSKPNGQHLRRANPQSHLQTLLWKNWLLKKRHWIATLCELVLPALFIALMNYLKTLSDDVHVPSGWSEILAVDEQTSVGQASSLLDPLGFRASSQFAIPYGSAVYSDKFVFHETTLSGLLLLLALRSATELRNTPNLTDATRALCVATTGFSGLVSTDLSSPTAIPAACRDHVTPYKLAIIPDTPFTRRYFAESAAQWYPRAPLSKRSVQGVGRVTVPAFRDSVVFFASEDALLAHVTSLSYGRSLDAPKIFAAIVFDQFPTAEREFGEPASIEYTLRLNATTQRRGGNVGDVPRTTAGPDKEYPFRRSIERDIYSRYTVRGFMTLQTLVARVVNCRPLWDEATRRPDVTRCRQPLAVATPDADTDERLLSALKNDLVIRSALFNALSIGQSAPSTASAPSASSLSDVLSRLTAAQSEIRRVVGEELSGLDAAAKATLLAPLRVAPQPWFGSAVLPLPILAFLSSPFYDQVRDIFALVFVLANLYALSRVLVVFIQEKETRAREYMKILGVREHQILLAWYVTYIAIFVIAAVLQTLAAQQGLFRHSDGALLFLFFFLFSLSVLSFGFLVSTLFSRSRTGAFAGIVLFFLMYFLSSGLSASTPLTRKTRASVFAPVALAFAVQILATVESTGVGLRRSNVHVVSDNYRFDVALVMLLFDSVLYSLLGLYLEKVVPKEYGTTEPWYFPVSYSYWRRVLGSPSAKVVSYGGDNPSASTTNAVPGQASPPHIEPVSAELADQESRGDALVIRDLVKTFAVPGGTKTAVKGVRLTLYKDQITCLLGHNGAGKSTLIAMLTGVTAPTSGDAFFRGRSFTADMRAIRQSLGLCFQHDVLYPELSVEEHLAFYGRIKGYRGAALQDVVTTKIREVGLTEKRRVFSRALSGGMKRKLSVAIALLGDSALVFLDEPTSGMDPYSRRSTWEILLNNRPGRVMVLTTHFMDEADILGDRIAILAEGRVRCCGSSLFLKNRFGAGYTLTIVHGDATHAAPVRIQELVTAHVASARVLSDVGAELAFQLPLEASAQFPALFDALDDGRAALGVRSYGISVTTLEEVFIKVAEASDSDAAMDHTQHKPQHTLQPSHVSPAIVTPTRDPAELKQRAQGARQQNAAPLIATFRVHLAALLLKRFRLARRDRRVLLFSALLPVLLLAAGLALLKTSSITRPDVKLRVDEGLFRAGPDSRLPYHCSPPSSSWCARVMQEQFSGAVVDAVSPAEVPSPPYSAPNVEVFGVQYAPPAFNASDTTGYCLRLGEAAFQRGLVGSSDRPPQRDQYGAFLVHASPARQVLAYSTFVNTTATHAPIVLKARLDQALYRFLAAPADVSLRVNLHPLPFTTTMKALFNSFLAFTACIFIVIAFTFFPAAIAVHLVKEKVPEHNAKHQQLVSGVSLSAFWLSNWLWDLLAYLVPFIAALVLVQAFDVSTFTGRDCNSCEIPTTFQAVVLLFALFGLAIAPFTYCLTFLLRDPAASQTYTILLNFFVGVVLMVVSFVLDIVDADSKALNAHLKFLWRFSPLYCLGNGLLNLTRQEIRFNIGVISRDNDLSPFALHVMGYEMLYLVLDTALYLTIAIVADVVLSVPQLKALVVKDPVVTDPAPLDVDEDVQAEAARVDSDGAKDAMVVLSHLRKVYASRKVAVRGVTLALGRGECFGYLGINGAGKTTTMKMLTGDVLPSSGTARLDGLDILSQQLAVRRRLGYCPQFDALFELLSVREHLELFARIKGVAQLHDAVRAMLREMNLEDFEHKLAGTLSGGNKRKLSVAIALLGAPPIVFLDEPSTGMDPVSRRFMWNVLARRQRELGTTIVLTTHSMEECEALCSRVGIMVGGRLRCLGSIQHLKSRFGTGLMLELKLEAPAPPDVDQRVAAIASAVPAISTATLQAACAAMGHADWAAKISPQHPTGFALHAVLARDEPDARLRPELFVAWWIAEERFLALHAFLAASFPEVETVTLVERQNDLCRYRLASDALRLGDVFRRIERGRGSLHLREYAVSQTTLEQIFNAFAAQQSEERGVARGMATHAAG
ncbi:hypothetical protein P43SY_002748 [Pythium insidiosum]|uniref:ABC transporter domain-containing protein n=1 Tax=Pythium insidiosum TaxID=114742 RepID=A0AAD5LRE5_PYTIN|nr:hypothetical protein P43SY_002748 [Pythium insidiosum]